ASALSISPFSSNDIPSKKCAKASALCSPSARSKRSLGGTVNTESSCQGDFFVATALGETWGPGAAERDRAKRGVDRVRKNTAKIRRWRIRSSRQLRSIMLPDSSRAKPCTQTFERGLTSGKVMLCILSAFCGDSPAYACGAYVLRFSPYVFS